MPTAKWNLMHRSSVVLNTIFLSAVLLSGCSFIDSQYGYVPDVPPLSPQSYHEVLAHLGAPDTIAVVDNKIALVYHSIKINEPQLGLAVWGADWLKFSMGDAVATHDFRYYSFGAEGEPAGSVEKKWSNPLGEGSALGIIFTAAETIDQSRFRDAREALLWGNKLLQNPELAENSMNEIIEGKRLDIVGQRF